jgi:hypothetical protein
MPVSNLFSAQTYGSGRMRALTRGIDAKNEWVTGHKDILMTRLRMDDLSKFIA